MLAFNEIRLKSQPPEKRYTGVLISFDPGHTTGYSVWVAEHEKVTLVEAGQFMSWTKEDIVLAPLLALLDKYEVSNIVFESYQVYEWKSADHSWSQVPTIQIIGCIKTICQLRNIPYHGQTAQVAKQFVTDDKLEKWGYYKAGMRHARDAIRHACYFLLFRPKDSS